MLFLDTFRFIHVMAVLVMEPALLKLNEIRAVCNTKTDLAIATMSHRTLSAIDKQHKGLRDIHASALSSTVSGHREELYAPEVLSVKKGASVYTFPLQVHSQLECFSLLATSSCQSPRV
jgi:hypothetical protein